MSKLAKALSAAAGSAGGDNLYPEDVFSTYMYAGSNGARTIANGISLSDEGGLVWLKNRGAVDSHVLFDTVNGPQKSLASNDSAASSNYSSYLSFPSAGTAGWNLAGATLNGTGTTWDSWSFRKAPGFFDIQTWTGNGTAGRTIAHNLGSAPKFVLVKRTNTTNNWICWHSALTNTQYIQLNSTSQAFSDGGIFWNSTTPDATNLTLGNDSGVNGSGSTYVAYLFGDDAVFGEDGDEQICKMGTATLGGSGTGEVSINLGFEPQFVLLKTSAVSENWLLVDNMNGAPVFPSSQNYLSPNTNSANASYSFLNITSTGFNLANLGLNRTYIYMAIRRPMKVPTAGTEVYFQTTANAGTTLNTGFVPDFWIGGATAGNGGTASQFVMDRLRGPEYLATTVTTAEVGTNDPFSGFPTNTFTNNSQGGNRVEWIFRRASQFMDVVAYTGDGTSNRAVAHNLTVVPEMMVGKNRSASSGWAVYHTGSLYQAGSALNLNSSAAGVSNTYDFGGASGAAKRPDASSFYLGSANLNSTNDNYITYLFATLAGISKVGSVVHSGTTNVDCGFSAGARFVLVKRTDSTGDWYVWDSVRGIVAGNDPYLLLNSSAAQVTNTDYIDPLASGFTLTSSFTAGTYIFLAIA